MKRSAMIFIALIICFSTEAFAIDTGDWETVLGLQFSMAKPDKNWLIETAYFILKDAFPGKGKDDFNKFYDSKTKDVTVRVPDSWHDIVLLKLFTMKTQRGDLYVVVYSFRKGSITIADVISRYGVSLAKIETNKNLEKEITYALEPYNNKLFSQTPLWRLTPRSDYQGTRFIFRSKDKLFIDELVAMTEITDLSRPDESVEKKGGDNWWEKEDWKP